MDSAPHFPGSAAVTHHTSALGTRSQRRDWGRRSGQWAVEATAKPNVVRYRRGRACLGDPGKWAPQFPVSSGPPPDNPPQSRKCTYVRSMPSNALSSSKRTPVATARPAQASHELILAMLTNPHHCHVLLVSGRSSPPPRCSLPIEAKGLREQGKPKSMASPMISGRLPVGSELGRGGLARAFDGPRCWRWSFDMLDSNNLRL